MNRCSAKVLENEHKIKVLQAELNTLHMGNFDLAQCDNKERWVRQMHQAFCCGLQ
jgi:hypothetical protein